MSQVNIRLPENLRKNAEKYVKQHNYKNLQELIMQALREKIDDEFSRKEIELIERFTELALKEKLLDAEEVFGSRKKSSENNRTLQ